MIISSKVTFYLCGEKGRRKKLSKNGSLENKYYMNKGVKTMLEKSLESADQD